MTDDDAKNAIAFLLGYGSATCDTLEELQVYTAELATALDGEGYREGFRWAKGDT